MHVKIHARKTFFYAKTVKPYGKKNYKKATSPAIFLQKKAYKKSKKRQKKMPSETTKTGMTFGRTEPPIPLQKKPRQLPRLFPGKKKTTKKIKADT